MAELGLPRWAAQGSPKAFRQGSKGLGRNSPSPLTLVPSQSLAPALSAASPSGRSGQGVEPAERLVPVVFGQAGCGGRNVGTMVFSILMSSGST